ncbi:MAG: T9SS type A sorting domain-containing protein, partial [Bacteroidales bacterium]|jgi:hypothetical protein|nr:T9SS type A sorting domain-containing protein [Bacteroidales bacterium]
MKANNKIKRLWASSLMTAFLLVACCVLHSASYAQTFSGGSGTQADPYKISKPEDLVELSNFTNVNKGVATVGQYFVLTNNINMAGISNFVPIGIEENMNIHYFCGNFDGKRFAIKNLTIKDTAASTLYIALFGKTKGATIANIILDKASIIYTGSSNPTIAVFVATSNDSLYMDNCIALNSNLKGGDISGFLGSASAMGWVRIDNCHVINATMEGSNIKGFTGNISNSKSHISNSSVRYSTLTGSGGVSGFLGNFAWGGKASNCYVSNCILTSNGNIGGFVNLHGAGEIDNCYVQAVLSRTKADNTTARGFAWSVGAVGANMSISNCYAACEFKSVDNNFDNDIAFSADAGHGSLTATNCYYKTDSKLGGVNKSNMVGKSEADLKNAAMVAYPGSLDNSLNYNQSSKTWTQDIAPIINKGYPILDWQTSFSYVSTYDPTGLTNISATLQGFAFTDKEIITEKGFQWREKGGSWTKVIVTDTTATISYVLTGLTKNKIYEYYAYMQTATLQLGDTIEFSTLGEHIISGKVTLESGSPLAGVTISCSGQPNATTNTQGEYSFIVPSFSNITLTPSLSGYSFEPSVKNLSDIVTDQLYQDFVAKVSSIVVAGSARPTIQIYPNPTNGQLRITNYNTDRHSEQSEESVTICDVVGQVIFTSRLSELSSETTIDISHLANGLYFLKIENKIIKIIKN